jgi:hypothetical protein
MRFVSFYTPNGKYPELAKKLQASLDKFALEYDIELVDDFGTWQKGCAYKPQFILKMMHRYLCPIVWLDIDTEVWQYPKLLFAPNDFAVYNWAQDTDHHLEGFLNPDEMLCSGGVIKFGTTHGAIDLLSRWDERMLNSKNADDQELDDVYNENADVNPLWLPKTYNRMDKHTSHWTGIPKEQVVINHDYTGGTHRERNV